MHQSVDFCVQNMLKLTYEHLQVKKKLCRLASARHDCPTHLPAPMLLVVVVHSSDKWGVAKPAAYSAYLPPGVEMQFAAPPAPSPYRPLSSWLSPPLYPSLLLPSLPL